MDLNNEIKSILDEFSYGLSGSDIEHVVSLLKAHEYGVALECLCVQIHDRDLPVNDNALESIKKMFSYMRIDSNAWSFLTSREPNKAPQSKQKD